MLEYTGVKIELVRDISIFDYVNSSIVGGVCIASQNIENDKDGIISSCDVCSLYNVHCIMFVIYNDSKFTNWKL